MASSNPVSPGVDSAFGAADGVVADVGGAFNQATLNNNFRDVVEAINSSRVVRIEFDDGGTPYLILHMKIAAGLGPGAQAVGTYEARIPCLYLVQIA